MLGALAVWFFREPLRSRIAETATLANDAPPAEVVEEMIQHAPDPIAAAVAAWNSGKVVHREIAIREVSRVVPPRQPLPPGLEAILLSGALDPDMDVRETAFSELEARNDPALTALAAAQLRDADPQVRLLGVNHLKRVPATLGVPLAAGSLDDSDLRVVGMSVKLLERWSGEKFGARLSDTVEVENKQTGLKEFQEAGVAKTRSAADRAKAWYAAHHVEFPAVRLEVPPVVLRSRQNVPASDFSLNTLDGQRVRLSSLRGRVVLLNFWTTWCTACVSEMPELVALKREHGDKLAIIGVSLDFVPDSHGHIGGHAAVEEQGHSDGHHDDGERSAAALKRVRQKVARTVKARGINYPVLLDEKNEVGGCFNGGELPTTVIVDAAGNMRRRFVGARSLSVFEAMIAEASKPVPDGK